MLQAKTPELVGQIATAACQPAPECSFDLIAPPQESVIAPTTTLPAVKPSASEASPPHSKKTFSPPSRKQSSSTAAPTQTTASHGQSLGVFESTCYAQGAVTASGTKPSLGTIAVDPRVIPLGTKLTVQGYGPGTALDTGGAIKGRRIDVYKPSEAACREWGRRPVQVFLDS